MDKKYNIDENDKSEGIIIKEIEKTKDSPVRSILKAFSWRIIASATTFLITFIIFRRYSEKNFDEVIQTATFITIVDFVAKILFYYLHERMWTNIKWGKYWKRHYWNRRAWKRLYRKMHKQQDDK
ncbi:MAG: hypothetical protein B6D64_13595 [Bacteroidetes bacterium 4484_276]|nr:MAG: hypothetical protein B6D64_13595 [Bacteroidetes bacterium 4484_276]OYT12982.1 MAG: hypothetical protein B6I19_07395 [Bacteroidetes bacterium 4572_114]